MRINYTSLGLICFTFGGSGSQKMQRRPRSRLRAKISGSGNKTFGGLKKPGRSTKLFMVLTESWETRKIAQSEKIEGKSKEDSGISEKEPRENEGDLVEAGRALRLRVAFRLEPGKGPEPENFRGRAEKTLEGPKKCFWIGLKALSGTDKTPRHRWIENYSGAPTSSPDLSSTSRC